MSQRPIVPLSTSDVCMNGGRSARLLPLFFLLSGKNVDLFAFSNPLHYLCPQETK